MKNKFIKVLSLTFLFILSSCSLKIDYLENIDTSYQENLNCIDKFNDENILQEIDNKSEFIKYINNNYNYFYGYPNNRIEFIQKYYSDDRKKLYPNILIIDKSDSDNYYYYCENLGIRARYYCVRYEDNFVYKSYANGNNKIFLTLSEGKEKIKSLYEDKLPGRINSSSLSNSSSFYKATIYNDKYTKVEHKISSESYYIYYYDSSGIRVMYETCSLDEENNLKVKTQYIYNLY